MAWEEFTPASIVNVAGVVQVPSAPWFLFCRTMGCVSVCEILYYSLRDSLDVLFSNLPNTATAPLYTIFALWSFLCFPESGGGAFRVLSRGASRMSRHSCMISGHWLSLRTYIGKRLHKSLYDFRNIVVCERCKFVGNFLWRLSWVLALWHATFRRSPDLTTWILNTFGLSFLLGFHSKCSNQIKH